MICVVANDARNKLSAILEEEENRKASAVTHGVDVLSPSDQDISENEDVKATSDFNFFTNYKSLQ